jgi:hypothetical protein
MSTKLKTFNQLPEHEQFYMLKSMNMQATLAELGEFTNDYYLRRIKFNLPQLNACRKKILDGHAELMRFFNVHTKKKSVDTSDEKMEQIFRVLDFFIEMDSAEIEKFMDGIDEIKQAS